jgi:hypothetical protein
MAVVLAMVLALLMSAPAAAEEQPTAEGPTAAAPQLTRVGEIRIPKDGAVGEEIVCFVDIRDPVLRPDALVGTSVDVSCTEEMFSIYAEVGIVWDNAVYQPSVRTNFSVLSVLLEETPSGGAPCNTGSTYYGITYVEVVAQNGLGDADEFTSLNDLIC